MMSTRVAKAISSAATASPQPVRKPLCDDPPHRPRFVTPNPHAAPNDHERLPIDARFRSIDRTISMCALHEMEQEFPMKRFLASLALIAFCGLVNCQDAIYHHDLVISIDPETSQLVVEDTISIPETVVPQDLVFSLHEALTPQSLTDGVQFEQTGSSGDTSNHGMDRE